MNATIARFKRQLLADRRKLAAMTCLLAVALLLWGRLLLKDVPRTAVAKPGERVAASVEGGAAVAPVKAVADKNARPVVTVAMYPAPQRDLFAFDPRYFPMADVPQGNTSLVDKSPDKLTDDSFKQQQLQLLVQSQAKALKLQSTLLGGTSRAMINGNLLEVGQTIQGFLLKEVRSRAVVIEKDGVEVMLEM